MINYSASLAERSNRNWVFGYGVMFVAFVLVLRIASTPTANASYVLVAMYALGGRGNAIRALFLSWILTVFNPGIAEEATLGAVGRYAVIGCSAISVFMHSKIFSPPVLLRRETVLTLVVGLFLFFHSFFFSEIPDVSLLKAASWMLAAGSIVAAWLGVSEEERRLLEKQIFFGLSILLLLSLPLLFSNIGFLRNGTGFQGVFNHPQVFGPVAAVVGAWLAGRILSSGCATLLEIGFFVLCLVLVVLSEARTAGIAMVLGVFCSIVAIPFVRKSRLFEVVPGLRSKRLIAAVLVGLFGVTLAGPFLAERVGSYIVKRGQGATLAAAYEESRGSLVMRMLENIRENPVKGIGFGVASDPMDMEIKRDPVLGLPTGAAVEKGVLPLALLEEVGVVGFVVVAFWLVMLIRRSALGGLPALSVLLTVLLLNMGEAAFFSPGGFGLLLILLVGYAISCDWP